MRVLVVAPTFYPSTFWGGPTTAMHALCNALTSTPGMVLEVVTTDSSGPSLSDRVEVPSFPTRVPAGYDVYYCRRQLFVSVAPSLLLWAWRRMQQADIVHLSATYSFPTLPILAMARALSKPVVWSPHGAMIPWSQSRKRILKAIWNHACRALLSPARSVIHVASDREASSVRSAICDRQIRVIPFGVDVAVNAERPKRTNEGALHLLYLGRLDPIKGIENLLRALSLSPATAATLSICGTGDSSYVQELTNLANELNLGSRVTFRGHVESQEKFLALSQADALILPSFSENFGIVVAEALAHGVPVIASTGTPWAAVEDQECGLWVDNSPQSLADAIGDMQFRDLRKMGDAGRLWVQRTLSWSAVSSDMTAIYERLLQPTDR